MRPLDRAQLQWFIDVEKPSQQMGQQIDGMYVRLLASIIRQADNFPERDRLIPMIKTIIDEGQEHWMRFIGVQKHLEGLEEANFLRLLGDVQDEAQSKLITLSDENYSVLLGSLAVTFQLGDRAAGLLLEQSRRAMFNLHEINHLLASKGVAPKFTLPQQAPILRDSKEVLTFLNTLQSKHVIATAALGQIQSEVKLAEGQRRTVDQLIDSLKQIVLETK